jgi:hypothetical protein
MIPDDIVVFDIPGEYDYVYPDWARWAIVTFRGADGGRGSDGTPGGSGQSKSFPHKITPGDKVQVIVGVAGRDFDGVRRGRNAYILLELFG